MGSIRGEGGAGGGGGGGLADLVDDTTPQLGGNLDVNGYNVGGATPTQVGYLAATTAAGAALLDDANAAAQRTTLGLGTAAVAASGDFQAANANLTALAGQTGAADNVSYWTAAATLALAALTAFGRSLIAAADAAGVRTLLGLGTAATTDASAYQAADAELTALAGLTSAADKGIQFTGSGTAATYDLTAAGKALLDDANASAQRTTIGVGTGDSPSFANAYVASGGKVGYTGGAGPFIIFYSNGALQLIGGAGCQVAFGGSVDGAIRLATELGWSSSPFNTANDVGIKRTSANNAKVTNGSTGSGVLTGNSFVSDVTTGTAPFSATSTTVCTNLNADKLDGKDATDFAPCTQATLTAAASVALDFAAAGLATLTTDQNTTFTTSNRAAGRQPYNLRIVGGGAHTLTFPAGWVWLSSTMPASIASGKTGRLSLECYGSADTDVVASFAVET